MKILFLTTQFPYPLNNGGKIGAFNGIQILEKYNKITVVSFDEDNKYEDGIKFFKKKVPNVNFIKPISHHIHIQNRKIELCKVMAKSYFTNIPYAITKFINKNMYKLIDSIFSENYYDIIFIDYLPMTIYGQYIKKKYSEKAKHIFLKDHNIEYKIFRDAAKAAKGIKKLILAYESKRTKKYEENAVQNAALVFTVCDDNTNYFKRYNRNVYTMKPVFEIKKNREYMTTANRLLYIGNLSWTPNFKGIQWFLKNVWPDLKRKIPDVTLDIVGSGLENNPFPELPGINYLGYVDDITDIYKDYKVFIVPLFEGSGIRIKILEAFNNDIAVISTTLGCETIGCSHQRELLIADNSVDFVHDIIELLNNNENNNKLRKQAKSFFKENYSLSNRQTEIEELLVNIDKLKSGMK